MTACGRGADEARDAGRLTRVGDIEQLATDFDYGQLRADPGGLVEIVEGVDAIRARMSDLLGTAQADIAGLDAPPYVMDSDECEALERLALKRGVRYRCLYGTSALDNAGKLAYISAMEQAGEQPRLVRTVPLKLFVFDRRTAIIPLTRAATEIRQPRLRDGIFKRWPSNLWWRGAAGATPPSLPRRGLLTGRLLAAAFVMPAGPKPRPRSPSHVLRT